MNVWLSSRARLWAGGILIALLVPLLAGAAPPAQSGPAGRPSATPTVARAAVPAVSPLLQTVASRHQTTLGVYVHHLGTGEQMQMNADQVFRSASLYKLFVLYEAYARLAAGTLSNSEMLTMSQQALINEPYAEWPVGTRTTVDCAMSAMVTISSNAAAAMILERLGGEPVVTANARARGYTATEITVEKAFTSPRDVGRLLEAIATDRAVSPAASAAMRRLLLAQRHNDRIPLPLPLSVSVGHKTGELTRLRHDAGIVYARSGSYVIVAMTDQASSEPVARGAVLDLSRAVYAHFEPNSLVGYLGLPPRLAREILQLPDTQGRLDPVDDPEATTMLIASAGVPVAPGAEQSRLREVALTDLASLQRAANQAGAPFWVTEGYREPGAADAAHLAQDPTLPVGCTVEIPPKAPASGEADGTVASPTRVAGPSPSQHWLGTVVAISDASDRDAAAQQTEPTATARWLAANAWRYGFILALPETELGTRTGYEPWRLRWVGVELAAQLKDAPSSGSYATTVRAALQQAEAELTRR